MNEAESILDAKVRSLLDVVEQRRRRGATVAQALQEAVRLRARPIALTTATTVAGLTPLALSSAHVATDGVRNDFGASGFDDYDTIGCSSAVSCAVSRL